MLSQQRSEMTVLPLLGQFRSTRTIILPTETFAPRDFTNRRLAPGPVIDPSTAQTVSDLENSASTAGRPNL